MYHLDANFSKLGNLTESIQRRFTKMTDCSQSCDDNLEMPVTTTSYNERQKMLYIDSLQRRRKRYAII